MRALKASLALAGLLTLSLVAARPASATTDFAALTVNHVEDAAATSATNRLIGWRFSVTQDVDATALGYYVGSNTTLASAHDVALFQYDGGTWNQIASASLASGAVNPADVDAGFLYSSLASKTRLTTGGIYGIVATTGGSTDPYFPWDPAATPDDDFGLNSFSVNGPVVLDHTLSAHSGLIGRYNGTLTAPAASPYFDAYAGPNFKVAAVPELSSLSLLGSVLGLGGLALRRTRK